MTTQRGLSLSDCPIIYRVGNALIEPVAVAALVLFQRAHGVAPRLGGGAEHALDRATHLGGEILEELGVGFASAIHLDDPLRDVEFDMTLDEAGDGSSLNHHGTQALPGAPRPQAIAQLRNKRSFGKPLVYETIPDPAHKVEIILKGVKPPSFKRGIAALSPIGVSFLVVDNGMLSWYDVLEKEVDHEDISV